MAQTVYGAEAAGMEPQDDHALVTPSPDVQTILLPSEAGPPAFVEPLPEPRPEHRPEPPERPLYLPSSIFTILGVLAATLVLSVGPLGAVKHARDQQTAFATLRGDLANATTAVTQTDDKGRLQPLGTPLAVLDIPQIGVREVVFEGTTSGVLSSGPGHRRDSPMPGQAGVSVLMGRQAGYGGPFRNLKDLKVGSVLTVTTGQGKQTFRVISKRLAGDPVPPPLAQGKARLMLVTGAGDAWFPEGTLRVDADLVGDVQESGPRPLTNRTLPVPERPLQGDTSVWIWVLLISQVLFAGSVAVTWARYRWGYWQVWLTGGPFLLAVAVALADQVAQMLPNLL